MAQEARGREVAGAVAAELRAAMARQMVKPAQLADATGMARSTMSNLLAGKSAIDVDQLAKICRVLGLEPGDVMAAALSSGQSVSNTPNPGDAIPSDLRAHIRFLMDNPNRDARLMELLGDPRVRMGLSAAKLKQTEDEIRSIRRRELEEALSALPSDQQGNTHTG